MKVLFYKDDFAWPRSSGPDVHTYYMMRAMSEAGVDVSVVTSRSPSEEALAGILFEHVAVLGNHTSENSSGPTLHRFEERFRSYWGIPEAHIHGLGALARAWAVDAVVVCGLEVLPLLGDVNGPIRVWYAGDEWLWHHLSQVRVDPTDAWENIRNGAVKALYERAFRRRIDRAWTVSDSDRRAMRVVAGIRNVDTIPNGVSTDIYRPDATAEAADSAMFWGRLDFGPNIQAMEWFIEQIWPAVRAARPAARLTIAGFKPVARISALGSVGGVSIVPDLPDIRPEVARHALVVLPFVSGGGVKNKLLEAAAMGKAIVATPRTLVGLNGHPPIETARRAEEWVRTLIRLWDNPAERRAIGARAREWVVDMHSWAEAARMAIRGLESSLAERRR